MEEELSRPWLPGDPKPGTGPVNCDAPSNPVESEDEETKQDEENQ